MFSILSWNIMQGGGTRVMDIIQKLSGLKPSVIILSEFHNNATSGNTIRSGLLKTGYRHQFVTQSQSEENSVLIASLLPCQNEIFPNADPVFAHNILAVHFDPFSIMGVYLPHKKKHNLLNFIREHISNTSRSWIIAGDFNTGINGIDQEGSSFWYEDQLKRFSEIKLFDAFRAKNGDTKEYSWYSHQGNGFRYDYTYIHEDLLPIMKDCHYIHEWRMDKSSDHAPMFLSF
jgi:exodeoxyribonuclease III